MQDQSAPLQDRLDLDAAIRSCYGCGADNLNGLRIKSHLEGDEGICVWQPQPHHCSYAGWLNGGIMCTLIDCHALTTVLGLECRDRGLDVGGPDVPAGWTRALHVEFLEPVPLNGPVVLRARVVKKGRTSRTIECSIYYEGKECVKAEVIAVMKGL